MRGLQLVFGSLLFAGAAGVALVVTSGSGRGVIAAMVNGVSPITALSSGGKVPLDDAVLQMAAAITKHETGYQGTTFPPLARMMIGPGSRNNNPGNLRFIGQRGSTGADDRGFAVFPTMQLGWDALLRDVRAKLTGNTRTTLGPTSTVAEFFNVYAPRFENDTGKYIATVSGWLGLSPNFRFTDWVDFS